VIAGQCKKEKLRNKGSIIIRNKVDNDERK